MLSGEMESEAEWMKSSLATLVWGKLLKTSCKARDLPVAAKCTAVNHRTEKGLEKAFISQEEEKQD